MIKSYWILWKNHRFNFPPELNICPSCYLLCCKNDSVSQCKKHIEAEQNCHDFTDGISIFMKESLYLETNFTVICSWASNLQYVIIGSGYVLSPNRRLASTWTNGDLVYCRIHPSQGLNELTWNMRTIVTGTKHHGYYVRNFLKVNVVSAGSMWVNGCISIVS